MGRESGVWERGNLQVKAAMYNNEGVIGCVRGAA